MAQKEQMTNETIVQKTLELLSAKNVIVESIYAGYADEILEKEKEYIDRLRSFQVDRPISKYSSISLLKNGLCDLRFAGQSIGTVKVNKNKDNSYKRLLEIKPKQSERAKLFGYSLSIPFDYKDWNEKECRGFRSFFTNLRSNDNLPIHTKEHRIENFMLDCFAEQSMQKKSCLIFSQFV